MWARYSMALGEGEGAGTCFKSVFIARIATKAINNSRPKMVFDVGPINPYSLPDEIIPAASSPFRKVRRS